MIRERLDDIVLALREFLHERFRLDALNEIVLGEEREPDVLHELREVLLPRLRLVVHPREHRLVDALLGGHGDGVAGDELDDLPVVEREELVAVQDLGEVALDVALCAGDEVDAPVEVGERLDAQAVGRVELALEELAAGVADVDQLQEICRRQEILNVFLVDLMLRIKRVSPLFCFLTSDRSLLRLWSCRRNR